MKRTAHHHVNVERIFLVIESDCRYRPGFSVALKAIASWSPSFLKWPPMKINWIITGGKRKMEFDHVLRIIGEFGPHQRRLYVLLNLSLIPAAFQLLLQVFAGAEPSWSCLNSSANETCPRNKSHCLEIQYTSKFTSIVTEVSFNVCVCWKKKCKNQLVPSSPISD